MADADALLASAKAMPFGPGRVEALRRAGEARNAALKRDFRDDPQFIDKVIAAKETDPNQQ